MIIIALKIIAINLAIPYLEAIQVLVDMGIYDSRSDALRTALTHFLDKEKNLYRSLIDFKANSHREKLRCETN